MQKVVKRVCRRLRRERRVKVNCIVPFCSVGSRKWGVGNGEWEVGNGEWGMGNGYLHRIRFLPPTPHSPLPTPYSLLMFYACLVLRVTGRVLALLPGLTVGIFASCASIAT